MIQGHLPCSGAICHLTAIDGHLVIEGHLILDGHLVIEGHLMRWGHLMRRERDAPQAEVTRGIIWRTVRVVVRCHRRATVWPERGQRAAGGGGGGRDGGTGASAHGLAAEWATSNGSAPDGSPAAADRGRCRGSSLAVGESSVILLHPPLRHY